MSPCTVSMGNSLHNRLKDTASRQIWGPFNLTWTFANIVHLKTDQEKQQQNNQKGTRKETNKSQVASLTQVPSWPSAWSARDQIKGETNRKTTGDKKHEPKKSTDWRSTSDGIMIHFSRGLVKTLKRSCLPKSAQTQEVTQDQTEYTGEPYK